MRTTHMVTNTMGGIVPVWAKNTGFSLSPHRPSEHTYRSGNGLSILDLVFLPASQPEIWTPHPLSHTYNHAYTALVDLVNANQCTKTISNHSQKWWDHEANSWEW